MSNYYRSISKSIGDRERIGGGGSTGGRRENGGSGSSKRAGRAGEMENDDFCHLLMLYKYTFKNMKTNCYLIRT